MADFRDDLRLTRPNPVLREYPQAVRLAICGWISDFHAQLSRNLSADPIPREGSKNLADLGPAREADGEADGGEQGERARVHSTRPARPHANRPGTKSECLSECAHFR